MLKVLVPLAEGFEEIEAVTVIDVLRRANIDVVIGSLLKESVVGTHGIIIKTDINIDNLDISDIDMLILVGGMPGARNLGNSLKIHEIIKALNKENKYICAICAAPFILKEAGILNSKYTCFPSFEDFIGRDLYCKDESIVVSDNIITASGPSSALEFAIKIVEILKGASISKRLKQELLLE